MQWWIDTVKAVLSKPNDFFKSMKTTGGYIEPLKFFAVNATLGGLLLGITLMLGVGQNPYSSIGIASSSPLIILAPVILGLVLGTAGVFFVAAVTLAGMKIVGGKGTYESTTRVFMYSSATSLLTWIPFVNIIAFLYQLYLEVVGLSAVHGVSKARAFVGILVPWLAIGFIVFLVAGALLSLFIGSLVTSSLA